MANKNFKVRFGLDIGDDINIDVLDSTMTGVQNIDGDGASVLTIDSKNKDFYLTSSGAGGTPGNIDISSLAGEINLSSNNGPITFATPLIEFQSNTISKTTSGDLTISTTLGDASIILSPHGTGDIDLVTDTVQVGDSNATATITTNGTGNLVLNTNNGTNAGTLTLANGANGHITLAPNGTGDVITTFSNGGNLFNNRNYVLGVVRNSTTEAAGDIWAVNSAVFTATGSSISGTTLTIGTLVSGTIAVGNVITGTGVLNGTTISSGSGSTWTVNQSQSVSSTTITGMNQPYRGVSLDNSADTTAGAATIIRSFSGGAVSGSATRGRLVFEKARGTSASPTAVQAGDIMASIDATGYTSTGWVNDNVVSAVPAFFGFTASENWVSNTNLGVTFGLTLAPSATTITSGAQLVNTIASNPEVISLKSDRMVIGQGKTQAFAATGCSTSGTTLTIGTLTSGTISVGNTIVSTIGLLNNLYIVANLSGSGSGSTWQLSGSPGTLSGQAISGTAGMIGSVPATSATLDALQDLRLISNKIKSQGGTTQITTSSAGATLSLAGDQINLQTAAGTNLVVIDANTAKFNVPVTTEIITTTISEGTTYTPAATVDNNISVQINTLSGGTTVIDLASLTGNTRGGSYNILVFNNTASGTPLNVINSRISGSNLMSHTITTGSPRIIINAYVVGDYATATHLVVA
jgi:hypothetical protein